MDPDQNPLPTSVDEAAILSRVANYKSSGFTQSNQAPRTSQHMGVEVNVWVSDEALAAFRAIDPEDSTATANAFAEGTIVVKEQLDTNGQVSALTVMAKVYEGYNADVGDWWFAQTNPQGVVNGNFNGKVDFCIQCHMPQGRTDFLFGVPNDNK